MRRKSVTIKEDGTVVNFDRSSGKEYARSNDTRKMSRRVQVSKFNASAKYEEIIENATNPSEVERNEKHAEGRDYDVRFIIHESFGKDEKLIPYSGTLRLENKSGKFYAYDIINLDTIKEAPQANGFYPALSAPHASSNTLSQDVRMSKQIQEVQDEIADTKEKKDLTGDEKIEKTEDFIAVHNLTMDQLMKDIDMLLL